MKRYLGVTLGLSFAVVLAGCSQIVPAPDASSDEHQGANSLAPGLLSQNSGDGAALATQVTNENGFVSPLFGLATAPNGDILVADAGAGVVAFDGDQGVLDMPLPGVSDVGPIGRGAVWATTGPLGDPTTDAGQALHRVTDDGSRLIANLFAFEEAYDPDGGLHPDSNPFDVQSLGGRAALVVDSGGNDLLRVNNRGDIEVLAVFPIESVSTANLKQLVGCPDAVGAFAFVCGLPPQMPGEAVPTSVAVGPDGYYYVGELKGFPAPTNESNIWRVAPDASWADCDVSPDCVKVFDGGFTSIIDLAFGADGSLLVAELDESSWAAIELGGTPAGGTVNACDLDTLTCSEMASGIPILTAVTTGKDGSVWVTRNALIPPLANVIEIP